MDPFTQTFMVKTRDGEEVAIPMVDIDELRLWGMRLAINYASQVGASVILLLILLIVTKREKLTSSIFILNALCLSINIVRSILNCLFLTGNWFHPYAVLTGDYSRIRPLDRAKTITGNVMTLLLFVCIMISLSFQVWVVCVTTHPLRRILVLGVTSTLALVAVGLRFSVVVLSNIATMHNEAVGTHYNWLTRLNLIMQALAIWSYCAVFTVKLGLAILQRRKLGMSQFGPLQIIFIMGCQTMIVPACFTALQFIPDHIAPELGAQALTIMCIFLPLSAIWAGVITDDTGLGGHGPDAHRRLLKDTFGASSDGSATDEKHNPIVTTSTFTSGKNPDSPLTALPPTPGTIHVGHEWSVQAGTQSPRV
ncbi:hypothetical protein BS50DRAFT_621914 [Corynespora cassiicola Philippines]|uniref:Pheromone receptor n=1 Tax=Corynespora cassiicola Philippines TaxID=1448308 RepID=A0A2T2NL90_CORCC|nr:hypothetical protein BS50DRAFT_621914 [Corynespora cassiicola Philippines]